MVSTTNSLTHALPSTIGFSHTSQARFVQKLKVEEIFGPVLSLGMLVEVCTLFFTLFLLIIREKIELEHEKTECLFGCVWTERRRVGLCTFTWVRHVFPSGTVVAVCHLNM